MTANSEVKKHQDTTSFSGDGSIATTIKFDTAREAVESWLDLAGFIDLHKNGIYKKLEECDTVAMKAETSEGQAFFSESLPLISSIIHVGSSRANFTRATERIKESWPDADPAPLLSALTFIYIVGSRDSSLGASSRSNKKRAVWDRISRRVDTLIN